MPSSTFNSEKAPGELSATAQRPFAFGVRLWLVLAVILLIVLETGTRVGFHRISRIESRIAAEYSEARSIAPSAAGGPITILLLGNSLLHEGVNYDRIRQLLSPRARVVRFVVEQTDYLDWLYGIRRLLADGSRPDVIVLCLNTQALRSGSTRGDYSSYYLFRTADIPAVARAAHYDLTQTSSLYLGHFSLFYAGRNNLRNFLLGHVDPPYNALLHEFQPVPGALPSSEQIEQLAEARLRELRSAATAHGARFLFLIPPGFMAGEQEILTAGARVGTEVLAPLHTGALPESDFRDGFHLNAHGQAIFTDVLAASLREVLKSKPR